MLVRRATSTPASDVDGIVARGGPRRAPGRRRFGVLAALLAVVALLAGCRADVSTRVELHADGSGVIETWVVLDAQAVAKAGDLNQVLHLDDLRKAGWAITGPAPAAEVFAKVDPPGEAAADGKTAVSSPFGDGEVAVLAQRPFRSVDEANKILASLSGPNGPYRDVRLTRSTSFGSTSFTARGTVDFSKGLDGLGDDALTTALGGRTPATAIAELNGGVPLGPENGSVSLSIDPRGFSLAGERGHGGVSPDHVVAASDLGGTPDTFDVHGSQRHTRALVLAALAGLLVLAGVAVFIFDRLPGRTPPPPASVTRQRHSAKDGWELVQRRGGPGGGGPGGGGGGGGGGRTRSDGGTTP